MNQPYDKASAFLKSIFSDGTETFRTPTEPEPWDYVSVRIRMEKDTDANVFLLRGVPCERVLMSRYKTDSIFDWYEAKIYCREVPILYSFLIEWQGRFIHFTRLGAQWVNDQPSYDLRGSFEVIPGFHVPHWAKGALQYQILTDRFCNGNPDNDVQNREYYYARGYIRHAESWDSLPKTDDYRCLYGGDLVGVRQKLDYLQSLGVEVIYFNPIFVSPSGHKYDTQDYEHIDPHLTVIPRNKGKVLDPGIRDNAQASLYIRRTTHPENLEASNKWFADFCQEIHRRGMRIILDGVFNHCGSFHRWMNLEKVYPGERGAYGHPRSPYQSYFSFRDAHSFHAWWDMETLPKLYYEQSPSLQEEILRIAEKWVSEPYCIDGWRLDVGADLGMTPEFNHWFWKQFRRRVRAKNAEVLIIAEHYGNPASWLGGDEWDTVMNYDAFMDPVSFFLTGMEKHSDHRRDDLYQNGEAFFDMMFEAMSNMPTSSVYSAMDELSNHDHSRFMTRTNGRVGRLYSSGSAAASEGVRPSVFREAVVIQMTWPGAPTIYYGDEAGLTGWTDPDNRRTYPWGHEDQELIAFHQRMGKIRTDYPVLRTGSVKAICAGYGFIAYGRFDDENVAVVVCNNTEIPEELSLPLREIGVTDGTVIDACFSTDERGFSDEVKPVGTVEDGILKLITLPNSAYILTPEREKVENVL